MNTIGRALIAVTLVSGCSGPQPRWDSAKFSPKRLEIYRAESQSGPELEEHMVVWTGEKVYVRKIPDITIGEIAESFVELPDEGRGLLRLKFTAAGQEKIDLISKEHSGRPIAVFVDGQIRSAPIIRDTYAHGLMIGNFFARDEAEKLVAKAK